MSLVLCKGRLRNQDQKVAGNVKKSTKKEVEVTQSQKGLGRNKCVFFFGQVLGQVWAVLSHVCLQDSCTCFRN